MELRKDPEWLKAHMGKYLAIMGQEIVGEADNFHDLSISVRETHGYGPIFMQLVTEVYPREVRLRSRLKPPITSDMGSVQTKNYRFG